jgi:ribonuclease P protein component
MRDNRRFRPGEHIRRRADFEQIYQTGTRVSGRFMTVFSRPSRQPTARLGIAATRKIGGAVVRNRAKRLVRELFRHHKPPAGLDIVVVPRREFLDAPYSGLEREFSALLERAVASGGADRRPSRVGGARRARPDRVV